MVEINADDSICNVCLGFGLKINPEIEYLKNKPIGTLFGEYEKLKEELFLEEELYLEDQIIRDINKVFIDWEKEKIDLIKEIDYPVNFGSEILKKYKKEGIEVTEKSIKKYKEEIENREEQMKERRLKMNSIMEKIKFIKILMDSIVEIIY
ncbi:hypothetical protein [Methanococcus maripaludis]|uniref:Uncharacterized protein n=1 Tax=Methanococcus maripaludis TaxID=39152 RepID=A0A2L1C8J2_METMI|nr:hypothetical protein [Methanococcus maripaludis]AVB75649.1 hypothetical protein MMJJ_02300 [Methanococcus maripaludis]